MPVQRWKIYWFFVSQQSDKYRFHDYNRDWLYFVEKRGTDRDGGRELILMRQTEGLQKWKKKIWINNEVNELLLLNRSISRKKGLLLHERSEELRQISVVFKVLVLQNVFKNFIVFGFKTEPVTLSLTTLEHAAWQQLYWKKF